MMTTWRDCKAMWPALLLATALACPTGAVAHDPLGQLERALVRGEAGERALARGLLDPVLISPRINSGVRARAYYARGLLHYLDGHWVSASQDYRRALEFDPELAPALSALAWLHLHGLGVPRHPDRAISLYERAAEAGYGEAQFNLGLLLSQGRIIEPDPARALDWFEAAAAQGHVEAMAQAGQLLLRNRPDGSYSNAVSRARSHFERAAASGHLRAQLELGILLSQSSEPERDGGAAAQWLQRAAAQGSAAAQSRLGYLHLHGRGVPKDAALARQWFGEAARQGDLSAQAHLGWIFDRGMGGPADPQRAFTWYRRAAQRDHATAQLNLAMLYQSGRGVRADVHRARYWFERAAATGSESARGALAWLLATADDPSARDPERAIELARQAVADAPSAAWLDTLAAALATSGRFDDAVIVQQQALAVLAAESPAEASPTAQRRSAFLGRLARYQARQPWLDDSARQQ
ncbi:MAG: SEL1-like repeat protein [Gammaproteobacteria bacterium]|nr:SEL1-like repeat protein [Gammaproteobacteria bacterium]